MRARYFFLGVAGILVIANIYFISSSSQNRDEHNTHNHQHGGRHEIDTSSDVDNTYTPILQPPYVSIIVPLYNQLQYLEFALESVFSQSFDDYEVVIVNDGSTEWAARSTLENLKAKHSDKRITVLHKTRGGLSDARNAGIKQAKADWILPLDADDMLDPLFLQSAVDASKSHPGTNLVISDLVGFDAEDPTRIVSQWSVPKWDSKDLPNKNLLHCCPLYKKELWESAKGYNPAMVFGWEDWEFWLKANRITPIRPLRVPDANFYYRVKPGMHSFCTDHNSLCTSILKTVQPSFYEMKDVLHAHQIIANNNQIALGPIQQQLSQFCDTTALHLWRGIIREKEGKVQDAILDYEQAKRFAERDDWQPKLRWALAKRNMGDVHEATAVLDELFARLPKLRDAVATVFGQKAISND